MEVLASPGGHGVIWGAQCGWMFFWHHHDPTVETVAGFLLTLLTIKML